MQCVNKGSMREKFTIY